MRLINDLVSGVHALSLRIEEGDEVKSLLVQYRQSG
jgi:hypothetical protein